MVQNVWDMAPAVVPQDLGLVSAVPLNNELLSNRLDLFTFDVYFWGPENTVETLFFFLNY